MVWGAVIGAAASLAGDMFGAKSSAKAAAREARLNREFQERMSNTQYQRGVKDLKAAGLNPMLAYMGGGAHGGASTPSGSQASVPDMGQIGSRAVDRFNSARMAAEQYELLKAQTNKTIEEGKGVEIGNVIARESEEYQAGIKRQVDPSAPGSVNVATRSRLLQQELENLKTTGELSLQQLEQARSMAPEILKAQQLANKLAAANVAPAQIMEEVYKEYPVLRKIQAIRDLIFGSGSAIKPR